jgi:hypothetical protein
MPTTFGVILMGLLLVGMVVGLVLWVRDASRRRGSTSTGAGDGSAPFDENRAAAEQTRTVDRNGWV